VQRKRPVPQPRPLTQKVSEKPVGQKTDKGTVEEIQCESSDSEDDDVVYRTVIERPAGRSLRSQERQPPEERRQISDRADATWRERVQETRQKTPTLAADFDRGRSEERDQTETNSCWPTYSRRLHFNRMKNVFLSDFNCFSIS